MHSLKIPKSPLGNPSLMASPINKVDKLCQVCGTCGFAGLLVTCCDCKKVTKHIYCMKKKLLKPPAVWYCDACLLVTSMANGKLQLASGKQKIGTDNYSSQKPNVLDHSSKGKAIMLSFSDKHSVKPSINDSTPKKFRAEKTKFIPAEEAASLASGSRSTYRHRSESLRSTIGRNVMQCSISGRTSSNISVSAASKALKDPSKMIKGCNAAYNRSSSKYVAKKTDKYLTLTENHVRVQKMENIGSAVRWDSENNETDGQLKGPPQAPVLNTEKNSRSNAVTQENKELDEVLSLTPENRMNAHCHNGAVIQKMKTANFSNHSYSGDGTTGSEKKGVQLQYVTNIDANPFTLQACWKGDLDVFHVVSNAYVGIQAHFPGQVSIKVYEIVKQLPVNLQFKVLPRKNIWPKVFQSEPPMERDIGLFFFPCGPESDKEKYTSLLGQMNLADLAMRTCLGNIELLVFLSNQLPSDYQRINGEAYLWGIFRHVKQKKFSTTYAHKDRNCAQLNTPTNGKRKNSSSHDDHTIEPHEFSSLKSPRLYGPSGSHHTSNSNGTFKGQMVLQTDNRGKGTAAAEEGNAAIAWEPHTARSTSHDPQRETSGTYNSPPSFPRYSKNTKQSLIKSPLKKVTEPNYPNVPPGLTNVGPRFPKPRTSPNSNSSLKNSCNNPKLLIAHNAPHEHSSTVRDRLSTTSYQVQQKSNQSYTDSTLGFSQRGPPRFLKQPSSSNNQNNSTQTPFEIPKHSRVDNGRGHKPLTDSEANKVRLDDLQVQASSSSLEPIKHLENQHLPIFLNETEDLESSAKENVYISCVNTCEGSASLVTSPEKERARQNSESLTSCSDVPIRDTKMQYSSSVLAKEPERMLNDIERQREERTNSRVEMGTSISKIISGASPSSIVSAYCEMSENDSKLHEGTPEKKCLFSEEYALDDGTEGADRFKRRRVKRQFGVYPVDHDRHHCP